MNCFYNNWKFQDCLARARITVDTTLCDKVCQWLAAGRWFSTVSSTNKTDHNDLTDLLLEVALNAINLTMIISNKMKYKCTGQEGITIDNDNGILRAMVHARVLISVPEMGGRPPAKGN